MPPKMASFSNEVNRELQFPNMSTTVVIGSFKLHLHRSFVLPRDKKTLSFLKGSGNNVLR